MLAERDELKRRMNGYRDKKMWLGRRRDNLMKEKGWIDGLEAGERREVGKKNQ